MKLREILKSPILSQDKQWEVRKRPDGYESDITAFVRAMVQDEAIRDDQRWAWERWRNDSNALKGRNG